MHFPGETPAYRAARERLLDAERDLRHDIEKVAALRRELPLGGVIAQDYVFEEGAPDLADTATVRTVKLSELFHSSGRLNTLVLYSFMYGPNMKHACVSCTSILDSLNG